MMLRLTGYFDAAGHPDGEHTLAVGGYVSSAPAWLRFERLWRRELSKVGIEVFHMADFMACAKQFKNWRGREDEQEALLVKLAGIIHDNVRKSFSTMILLDAWKEVNNTYALKESHCTPYGICGFFTIDKTMRWLAGRQRKFQARFIFEDGDKHKGDFIWMVDQFVLENKWLHAGAKPHFEPKAVVQLQAADFVMWEQFNLAKDQLTNPKSPSPVRKSFQKLMTIPRHWGVLDEEKLVTFCVDFEVPKRGARAVWSGPMRASARRVRGGGGP
jgi:hypothetical protein